MIDEAMDHQSLAALVIGFPALPGLGKSRAFERFARTRHEIMRHGPAAGLAARMGDGTGNRPRRPRSRRETTDLGAGRGQLLGKAALEILRVIFPHRVIADLRY